MIDRKYGNPVNQVAGGASFGNAQLVTPSDTTPLSPGAACLWANVTTAGNLEVVMLGGQTVAVPVAVGVSLLPFAVTQVKATGTTAVATILALW